MRYALLTLAAAALSFAPVQAQNDPQLRPLTEHIAEINNQYEVGDQALGPIRYVFRRCGALYSALASAMLGDDDALAESYIDMSSQAMFLAYGMEVAMGADSIAAMQTTETTVLAIKEIIVERAQRNMALTGNYFVDDPLLRSDMETCKEVMETMGSP